MLEEFSPRAHQLFLRAKAVAIQLGATKIEPIHLLWAYHLYAPDQIEPYLKQLGANSLPPELPEALSQQPTTESAQKLKFAPSLQRVVQTATHLSALSNEGDHADGISAPVLLLALVQNGDTGIQKHFAKLGVGSRQLQSAIAQSLFNSKDAAPARTIVSESSPFSSLGKYVRDLKQADDEAEVWVQGREKELNDLIHGLLKKNRSNVLLVGYPGVGKTTVVRKLVQSVLHEEVPESLQRIHLLQVDTNRFKARFANLGAWEHFLGRFTQALHKEPGVLIVIDEIHQLLHDEGPFGQILSDSLKPLWEDPAIQVIGTTNFAEYRQYMEPDRSFSKHLTVLKVDPLSPEDTRSLLQHRKSEYELYHRVHITEEALEATVRFCRQHIRDAHLPTAALDLLDAACVSAQLEHLEVTPQVVEGYLSRQLGIPLSAVSDADAEGLRQLGQRLRQRVIGQERAIDEVCRFMVRLKAGHLHQDRPGGVLLFIGPTGVGKTELARQLARLAFGGSERLLRLDMSEYVGREEAVHKLIGIGRGYVDSQQGGILTNHVWENPHSLVLLDEVEKAHPHVWNILLQVFDYGKLTDGRGRVVDFSNTLIIMTSNAGGDPRATIGFSRPAGSRDPLAVHAELGQMLTRNGFPPEFLGRVESVIAFRPLSRKDMRQIAQLHIDALAERLSSTDQIELSVEASVLDRVLDRVRDAFGARGLVQAVKRLIEDPILLERGLDPERWQPLRAIRCVSATSDAEPSPGRRFLLVDPDPKVIERFRSQADSDDWIQTSDPGEALRLLQEGRFHLMWMDLQLGECPLPEARKGLELLAEAHRLCPGLPLIVHTRHTGWEEVAESFRLGASDYVQKPLSATQFRAIMERHVRKTEQPTPIPQRRDFRRTASSPEKRYSEDGTRLELRIQ